MKRIIGLIIRFWIDFAAILILCTLLLAVLDADNPENFAFSLLSLPRLALRCSFYAAAAALIFLFPRLSKLLANRAAGYAILFLAICIPFSCLAVFFPAIPADPAPPHAGVQDLGTRILSRIDESDLWVGAREGRLAKNIVQVAGTGEPPRIRMIPSAPYAPERGMILLDGRSVGRQSSEARVPSMIVQNLDFQNTGAWIESLGKAGLVDRLIALLAFACAMAFLWPLSRVGSWPMVSYTLSWLALSGFFVLASFFRSQIVVHLLAFVDVRLPESIALALGCGLASLACIAFDLLFIPSNKGRI